MNIAKFLGLPSLRPLQKKVAWQLHQRMIHSSNEPNILFLQAGTGTGKTYHPLVYMAYYELYQPEIKFVFLFIAPLQRAMDGCIAKVAKIPSFRALQLRADTMDEVVEVLTTERLEQSTIVFYNPSSTEQHRKLVNLLAATPFHRVRMVIADEISLTKQWMGNSFRPVLRQISHLVDTINERHFNLWHVPVLLQTAAASIGTRTCIRDQMNLPFNKSIVLTSDRPDVQVLAVSMRDAGHATRYVKNVTEDFVKSRAGSQTALVLHRGSVKVVKTLQEGLQKMLNPDPTQAISEPVGVTWSGSTSGDFEIRQFQQERICSSTHVASTCVLVGTDRSLGVGTDFPNVTLVIHFGPPSLVEEIEQYLGRNRNVGRAIFVCTYQQRCVNSFYVHRDLQDLHTDAEGLAEGNQELIQVDIAAELLMYPSKCIRQLLEVHFFNGRCCKSCRQLKIPLCTGCAAADVQSLLFDLRTFVPVWRVKNNKKKMQNEVDWQAVANGDPATMENLYNDCIKDFMDNHGEVPVGNTKINLVNQLYRLCCPIRFDERKMMQCVQQRVVAGECKHFGVLVEELAGDMKIEKKQARDVLQRLILHRTLTDEPPANMKTAAQATASTALDFWRVRQGPSWNLRAPRLQPRERTKLKISKRNTKNKKQRLK